MAKKPSFDGVNFAIWMVLVAIICIGLVLLYNKTVFEKFEEEEEPVKKKEEPVKKEKEPVKKKEDFDSKEQSIFDKIIKNEVSSSDLEKLINAGVVTQNMVEKFLSKLDEKEAKEAKIEPFCGNAGGYPL
jgi:hypothetical protein